MNKLLRTGIAEILLLLLSVFAYAVTPDFTQHTIHRFSGMWKQAPQEKVYLHTDKPFYYSAGEDIWFRAHLVNATTHKPDTRSQFVYVELIDKSDSVITRVKIKRNGSAASGKITLPPEIAPGEYILRSYTYWMLNVAEDFFFHKKIYIGNMIDDRVRISTSFGTPENGKIPLTITFKNTFSMPLSGKSIEIRQHYIPKNRKTTNLITNQQGEIHLQIESDTLSETKRLLEITLNEPGLSFNRKLQVPDLKSDFDVQFFPESGVFLDNQIQTVAFKAIGSDGLSVNVSGKIYNQQHQEICELNTLNKGMGKIIMHTYPGENYYAVVQTENGLQKKFDLPATSATGVSMKLKTVKGKVFFQVLNQSYLDFKGLFMLVHARGMVYLLTPLTGSEGFLSENMLPPGINTFSIIDSTGNTWCERIGFIRNNNFPVITMESNKSKYGKREPVELNFKLLTQDTIPAKGNFSVSVTDNLLVKNDSINNDILSYLLLSSDLKGYIEEPQQYFRDNSWQTLEKTDLLMLTQGWRRFNTGEIIKGIYPKTDYYLEVGQAISGSVLNLFNKPVKNAEVIFFSNYKNQINTAKTDSTGLFLIEGIQFPDSTQIILKAKSRSNIVDVELIPDKDIFPGYKSAIPFNQDDKTVVQDDYLNLSKERYYNEGGMLVINLDEFTVKGETKKTEAGYYYSGAADNSIDSKKLESFGNQSVLDVIRTFPGIQVSGESISIRGASGNPLFLIDGIETEEIEDLQFLNASDIEEISLFKGASASLFGSRGGNGVIAITLKQGTILQSVTPPSLVRYAPLGYQQAVEFYVPKYDVDSIRSQSKPDLRTTIYWTPEAKTDEDGSIRLKFYTADKPNDYRVELEGVSENGEICKFQGILKRE